jgi:hypothetical protein
MMQQMNKDDYGGFCLKNQAQKRYRDRKRDEKGGNYEVE